MFVNDPFAQRASGRLPDNATIEDILNLMDNDNGLSKALSGYSFGRPLRQPAASPTGPAIRGTPTKTTTIDRMISTHVHTPLPKTAVTPTPPPPTPMIPRDEPPPEKTQPTYPSDPGPMIPRQETQPAINVTVTGGSSTGGGGAGASAPPPMSEKDISPTITPQLLNQESKPFPWIWIGLGAVALFFFMQKKTA